MTTTIQSVALATLQLSQTGSQAERRAHFDKTAIAELADSIRTHGVIQPIVARRVNGHLEVVAGERRVMAAKAAGLEEIPATVRDLTDEQVLEIQLIENLQREGLHELAEAEGYEALQKLGHSADDIAAKVGRSRGYVYGRMKLLGLVKDARKAFYAGKINASIALLLARIPVEELQKQALKEVTTPRYDGDVMSVRDAARHIHDRYMLRLDQAGFPTGDPDLVPEAGPCGTCPKRTGNQPELFSDVKGADVCTDPVCFRAKRDAQALRLVSAAVEKGQEVITGKDAKKIAPHGAEHSLQGHVRLDERCYEDSKNRTYRQLLGKDFQPKLLQDNETGKMVEIAPESAVAKVLPKSGSRGNDSYQAAQRARDKKKKLESAYRAELFLQVRVAAAKRSKTLLRSELNRLAAQMLRRLDHDSKKRLFKALGWEPKKAGNHGGVILELPTPIDKLSDADLAQLLRDLSLAPDLFVPSWSDGKPETLEAAAAELKIDAKKVRAQLLEAAKDKAPAKASKKK